MKYLFPIRSFNHAVARIALVRFSYLRLLIAALLFTPLSSAMAAWNNAPETLHSHPTWIYTPSATMSSGKHGLLIVLHGCAQSHDELKGFGNLESTAEHYAMVVAVPSVGAKIFQGSPSAKCWDYDGASDSQGDIADLVNLATNLKARGNLNIDPDHVYVTGLSSGAGMALDVACKAPDIFAGVGAIAGPSVGSNQNNALSEGSSIPATNVDNAINKCKALAGSKAAALDTQIANIAFGEMDRNGPHEGLRFSPVLSEVDKASHAGQIALVSVKWSADNVKILQKIYGAETLGAATSVQGELGTQQLAMKNGKPRISLLAMHNIGHAWPAGTGKPNSPPPDGIWMAQSGLNYPDYIVGWLIANNPRPIPVVGPKVTATASSLASSKNVTVTGTARNPDGSSARVATALLNSASNQQVVNHGAIASKPDGTYSDTFENLQDSTYKVQVTATDNAGNTAIAVSNEVKVGNKPPPAPSPCFTDNNFNHVQKGRAVQCSSGFVCAKGSGDNLGLFNLFVTSSVVENPPGFFKKGMCSGQ